MINASCEAALVARCTGVNGTIAEVKLSMCITFMVVTATKFEVVIVLCFIMDPATGLAVGEVVVVVKPGHVQVGAGIPRTPVIAVEKDSGYMHQNVILAVLATLQLAVEGSLYRRETTSSYSTLLTKGGDIGSAKMMRRSELGHVLVVT